MLTESYEHGEVSPEKLEDPENFADPQTKYLTYKVWRRHNLPRATRQSVTSPNKKNKAKLLTSRGTGPHWGAMARPQLRHGSQLRLSSITVSPRHIES